MYIYLLHFFSVNKISACLVPRRKNPDIGRLSCSHTDPARFEPVQTYLGPHSCKTHVPRVRHPPQSDIKANS